MTKKEQLARVSKAFLSAQKVGNNTLKINYSDGTTAYRLHNTDVVTILKNGTIQLNSGGWQTVTTKDRINTFSNAGLYQKKGDWFLRSGIPFYDGIIINSNGSIYNSTSLFN